MRTFFIQTKRNMSLYFKDKAMFLTSLITPFILLILYISFLAKVYKDSFYSSFPNGFTLDEKIINGIVGGQLISSLLAVSCVTVAFCSNMIMVQDKANMINRDFSITPIKRTTLSLSYYVATFLSTMIVSLIALGCGLIYIACVGWYLTVADIVLILIDIIMLTLFGTAISSIINTFLSTQGQISAVATIVSSVYGFICGAYMPISNCPKILQKVLSFLPGTYGTSLIKNHCLRGGFQAMIDAGVPIELMQSIKQSIDCDFYFFDKQVKIGIMYAVMIISLAVLVGAYVLINVLIAKRKNKIRK